MPRKEAKDDAVYLADMLYAARAVRSFVSDKAIEDCRKDLLLRSAVERQIEIIGEAARRVSPARQASLSRIP